MWQKLTTFNIGEVKQNRPVAINSDDNLDANSLAEKIFNHVYLKRESAKETEKARKRVYGEVNNEGETPLADLLNNLKDKITSNFNICINKKTCGSLIEKFVDNGGLTAVIQRAKKLQKEKYRYGTIANKRGIFGKQKKLEKLKSKIDYHEQRLPGEFLGIKIPAEIPDIIKNALIENIPELIPDTENEIEVASYNEEVKTILLQRLEDKINAIIKDTLKLLESHENATKELRECEKRGVQIKENYEISNNIYKFFKNPDVI